MKSTSRSWAVSAWPDSPAVRPAPSASPDLLALPGRGCTVLLPVPTSGAASRGGTGGSGGHASPKGASAWEAKSSPLCRPSPTWGAGHQSLVWTRTSRSTPVGGGLLRERSSLRSEGTVQGVKQWRRLAGRGSGPAGCHDLAKLSAVYGSSDLAVHRRVALLGVGTSVVLCVS